MRTRRAPVRSQIAADDRLLTDLGLKVEELVESRTKRARGATDFKRYRKDPVGFAEHVLKVTTLWEAQ